MAESKIRCTTCYNVFNTTKAFGTKATCPMCDTSVTVSDKNIIGDIKKQITDLSDKIGKEVKKVITGKTKDKAILEINGKKYDKELINLVIELSKDKKEINLKNTKKIFTKINDYNEYTPIEKQDLCNDYDFSSFKLPTNCSKSFASLKFLYTEAKRT